MSNHYKLEITDYLTVILKKKKLLILIFFSTLFVAYGYTFFFIEKQYDATATIIPNGQSPLTGVSSLVKNISNVLPVGLGNINQESELDLYNTVIYSRTSMENLINQFDLKTLYKIKKTGEAVKIIRKIITTKVTMENAFEITTRTKTPQLASDMTNYIVDHLNKKIIELNVSKSKENRMFLEKRFLEIKENLAKSENILKKYQNQMGILNATDQMKFTLEAYSKLESELASKQIEYRVLNKIYGSNSSNVVSSRIALNEYKRKLENLKKGKDQNSTLIGLDSLPEIALDYYRLFRDVKINEEMLHFILPLYEQSKFEEQKDIPILQIVDPAIPPEKKAFPPRTLFAGFMASIILLFSISLLILKENLAKTNNPKILAIKRELIPFL